MLVSVCVLVCKQNDNRETEREKWTENYTEIIATIIFKLNYIQLQIKWNADGAKIATLSFGVMASLPREGQKEQQGRGRSGGAAVARWAFEWVCVCVGEFGVACVVDVVVARHKRQREAET